VKILIVAPQPFYQERGTPIATRLLAQTLCSFGHQVDLLAYHDGQDIEIPGMRIVRAGRPPGIKRIPIGISWQKLVCDVWLIARMLKLLRRNSYDVVHTVEEAIFPAVLLNAFYGCKLVYDMDSSLADQLTDKWRPLRPLRGLLKAIERTAVRKSDAVLAVCEDLAVKVRPWVGADRVFVLPDVPMGDSQPDVAVESLRDITGPNAALALYIGNLEGYQGIDLLLDGFAARTDTATDVQVVVIGGEPAHIDEYKRKAAALGIAARVHFLGPRPLANLGAYLRQADILVSPRILGQNTPMKVYSYMQAGKAILATDIRSHTQALDPECAALVAPQPAAFGAALTRLAADEELRRRLGAAARAKVEREFSLAVLQQRLHDAYSKLARGAQAPAERALT
jgi:glycosyltransferase involved in cell wall biosynthesis